MAVLRESVEIAGECPPIEALVGPGRSMNAFPVPIPGSLGLQGRDGDNEWLMRFAHLAIGGQLVPAVRVAEVRKPLGDVVWSSVWTADRAIDLFCRAQEARPQCMREGWSRNDSSGPEDRIRRHFDQEPDVIMDWCLANGVVVAAAMRASEGHASAWSGVHVDVNGAALRQFDLKGLMDSCALHAKLSAFVDRLVELSEEEPCSGMAASAA